MHAPALTSQVTSVAIPKNAHCAELAETVLYLGLLCGSRGLESDTAWIVVHVPNEHDQYAIALKKRLPGQTYSIVVHLSVCVLDGATASVTVVNTHHRRLPLAGDSYWSNCWNVQWPTKWTRLQEKCKEPVNDIFKDVTSAILARLKRLVYYFVLWILMLLAKILWSNSRLCYNYE